MSRLFVASASDPSPKSPSELNGGGGHGNEQRRRTEGDSRLLSVYVYANRVSTPMTMNSTTFDTHQAVRRLEAAGIETSQAEAIVAEMRDASTVSLEHLATKADLANAIAGLERRLIGYGLAIAGLLFAALKLL